MTAEAAISFPSRAHYCCRMEGDEGSQYGYAVLHDGAADTDEALHDTPFDGLEQARRFALDWLAERRTSVQRLAVVRLHRESGRRDTVAIVDPAELDELRGS
jgi:hypothetical protein